MVEICRVAPCDHVANVLGSFCHAHSASWAKSEERREIDFSSDASFEAQAAAFAARIETDEQVTEEMMEE